VPVNPNIISGCIIALPDTVANMTNIIYMTIVICPEGRGMAKTQKKRRTSGHG
jgi:hypothetical protein